MSPIRARGVDSYEVLRERLHNYKPHKHQDLPERASKKPYRDHLEIIGKRIQPGSSLTALDVAQYFAGLPNEELSYLSLTMAKAIVRHFKLPDPARAIVQSQQPRATMSHPVTPESAPHSDGSQPDLTRANAIQRDQPYEQVVREIRNAVKTYNLWRDPRFEPYAAYLHDDTPRQRDSIRYLTPIADLVRRIIVEHSALLEQAQKIGRFIDKGKNLVQICLATGLEPEVVVRTANEAELSHPFNRVNYDAVREAIALAKQQNSGDK